MKKFGIVLFFLSAMPVFANLDLSGWPPKHQNVIFDSDMSDVDDVGALVVLHKFADIGKCDILATMLSIPNNRIANIAKCMDAINTYYNRPNTPIGIVKNGSGTFFVGSGYVDIVGKNFPNDIDTAKVPEACLLYQQILNAQPDTSVTIIITGYPTNVAQLLMLTGGVDLVRRKVRMIVQMGGSNGIGFSGREGNLFLNAPASKIFVDSCHAPVVFSGFEVGSQVYTGAGFRNTPVTNPARAAYSMSNFSRSSWDPLAVLFAFAGIGPAPCYFKIAGTTGHQTINLTDSSNFWSPVDLPEYKHAYICQYRSADQDPMLVTTLDSIYAVPPTASTPNSFGSSKDGSDLLHQGICISAIGGGLTVGAPLYAPWELGFYALNGTMIGRYAGKGSQRVSFNSHLTGGGFVLAKLRIGMTEKTARILIR